MYLSNFSKFGSNIIWLKMTFYTSY